MKLIDNLVYEVIFGSISCVEVYYGHIATQEELDNPEIVKELIEIDGTQYNIVRG